VARLGNLSRAAAEMFLTQPTLTARLKSLEEEVGDQLFVRTSRGMRLTEAGKEFLPFAERSVASFEEGRRRLEDLRGGSGGRLVLGASPGVGTYALPGLLERFTAAYPRVSVSVRTGHSEDILEMVLREEVQLGLTRAMRHPEVESLRLYEDQLVLVVDPEHRFTAKGSAGLAEIGGEQLILFDHDSSYYEQTHALFRNAATGPLAGTSLLLSATMERLISGFSSTGISARFPAETLLTIAVRGRNATPSRCSTILLAASMLSTSSVLSSLMPAFLKSACVCS